MLTHSLSWNSPSVTRLIFHTKQQFRSSIWKGSEKGAGMIKICSSSYKRDNCTCQDSSLWEGDDLGIPLTGRKGVKGTDRSLFFPKHELGSLAMVLGTRVKRRYFISWWLCTGGMLCQSPAQTEKLMWIPMRDCKYFRDTKTNHSRFRKYTELRTGRHLESIRAPYTLSLFVPFSGHEWTWNTV